MKTNTIFISENNQLAVSLIRNEKHTNLSHVHYYYILQTKSDARLINNSKLIKSKRFPKYIDMIGLKNSADDSSAIESIPNNESRLRLNKSFKKTDIYQPLITKTTAFTESELEHFLEQRFT